MLYNQGTAPGLNYLWAHTYGHDIHGDPTKNRFVEHTPQCVVLDWKMKAAIIPKDYDEDGDVHFNVIPDPKLQDLLNLQSGDEMVVEVICWNKPSTEL